MDVEVDHLTVIEGEAALKQVNQDHRVVVGVPALPLAVGVTPEPVEGHADGPFPLWADVGVAARAIERLSHFLPGLLPAAEGFGKREDETEQVHG